MTARGSAFSSMFNVSGGRYDLLEVWNGVAYVNVADALNSLAGIPDQIAADETRIQALEDKSQSLDENKAPRFVAVSPLYMKTDVTPQQLYATEPPPPVNANAIVLNGTNAYIEFSGGRADVFGIYKRLECGCVNPLPGPRY